MIDLMRAAGLEPRVDPAGNIFGRRAGTDGALPPILFGSHIDSVPNGGNFDGDLGSLSALGVLEALAAAGLRTRHPLEMAVWANEEGVAFSHVLGGSRVVAGDVKSDLNQVWNGMTRADAIRKIGGDPTRITDAIRPRGAHHCYLELHIEQGATLDREKIPVGVVEGIVAIDRYDVTVYRPCESRRLDRDGGSARCSAGRVASDHRCERRGERGTWPTSRHGRPVGRDPQRAECDSGRCQAHDRASRSLGRKTQASG